MDNNTGQLVDDPTPGQANPPNALQQAVQAISNLILPQNRELITLLRQPSPVKVTRVHTVAANGTIGVNALEWLYICPMSTEAWLNRISISSPQHLPSSPLTTGYLICTGSNAGEIIFSLPEAGINNNTLPAQFIEGRVSAPHLSPGETAYIVGGGLTAGDQIRFDLQITLVQGVSEFTPKTMSPTDLTARGN